MPGDRGGGRRLAKAQGALALLGFGAIAAAFFGCEARTACDTICSCREGGCTAVQFDECVAKGIELKESECNDFYTVLLGCMTGESCTDGELDIDLINSCLATDCLSTFSGTCACTYTVCDLFEIFARIDPPEQLCDSTYGPCVEGCGLQILDSLVDSKAYIACVEGCSGIDLDGDGSSTGCEPGTERSCECSNGETSTQTCQADGVYGSCQGCPVEGGPVEATCTALCSCVGCSQGSSQWEECTSDLNSLSSTCSQAYEAITECVPKGDICDDPSYGSCVDGFCGGEVACGCNAFDTCSSFFTNAANQSPSSVGLSCDDFATQDCAVRTCGIYRPTESLMNPDAYRSCVLDCINGYGG